MQWPHTSHTAKSAKIILTVWEQCIFLFSGEQCAISLSALHGKLHRLKIPGQHAVIVLFGETLYEFHMNISVIVYKSIIYSLLTVKEIYV